MKNTPRTIEFYISVFLFLACLSVIFVIFMRARMYNNYAYNLYTIGEEAQNWLEYYHATGEQLPSEHLFLTDDGMLVALGPDEDILFVMEVAK